MKSYHGLLLVSLLITSLLLQSEVVAQTALKLSPKLQSQLRSNALPAPLKLTSEQKEKLAPRKIDLASSAIQFTVLGCKTSSSGTVKIEGIVRNVGGRPYSSGTGQQVVSLYQYGYNGEGYRAVASRTFTNLPAGGEIRVAFSRPWNKSDEFPPKYILVISYDPDILLDSNESNDDVNSGNDRIERSGEDINALPFKCK